MIATLVALKTGQFTDLLVFSHGWNNDIDDARSLYEKYFQQVASILESGQIQGMDDRQFAVVTLFWPSKRFTDEELIPGGGAASINESEMDQNILRQLDELKQDPIRLGRKAMNPIATLLVEQAKGLLPKLESEAAARKEFVMLLRSMLNPNEAHPDDGSEEFFTADPELIVKELSN